MEGITQRYYALEAIIVLWQYAPTRAGASATASPKRNNEGLIITLGDLLERCYVGLHR